MKGLKPAPLNTQKDDVIAAAICYVVSNPAIATLKETAKRFGYSPDYLSRQMKQLTGKTFLQLKQDSAILHSRHLLGTTTLPVSEIAEQVGIKNLTRFYRLFREHYASSPGEYRKKAQAKNILTQNEIARL